METVLAFLLAYLFMWLIILGLCVAQYVINSMGLYSLAKRRGIRNPWLAWVPVGSSWVLGCISDQYQYVTKGLRKSRRKLLLGLELAGVVLPFLFCVVMVVLFLLMALLDEGFLLAVILGYFGGVFLMVAVGIGYSILRYIALYDLYASADPNKAVLYLLLSVFLGAFAQAVVVFLCRNKDEGMPPRPVEAPAPVALEPGQDQM